MNKFEFTNSADIFDFGNLGHRTPINALGRLYDYLIEINHFTI